MTHATPFQLTDTQRLPIYGEYSSGPKQLAHQSIVILVHGFGVERDSRGMFTELSDALQENHTVVLFDLNPPRDEKNHGLVLPVTRQAERLEAVLNWAKKLFANTTLHVISHSLGGVITGLSDLQGVNDCILLAPPHQSTYQRMIERFQRVSSAFLDESGASHIPRSDGSVTILPPEFWQDVKKIKPVELYSALAKKLPTTIVYATEDEVLHNEEDLKLTPQENLKTVEISGDHNFSGKDRAQMIETVKTLLT